MMLPVDGRQPLGRQPMQPRVEGEGSISLVVGQLPRSVEQRLLHDVGGIHPRREPGVQPQRHHPPQSLPMPLEQASQRRLISARGIAEQAIRLVRIRGPCTGHLQSRHPVSCRRQPRSSPRFLHRPTPNTSAGMGRLTSNPIEKVQDRPTFFVTVSSGGQDYSLCMSLVNHRVEGRIDQRRPFRPLCTLAVSSTAAPGRLERALNACFRNRFPFPRSLSFSDLIEEFLRNEAPQSANPR